MTSRRVSTTATVPSDGTDRAGPGAAVRTDPADSVRSKSRSEVRDTVLVKLTIDSDSEDEDSKSRSESVTPATRPGSRSHGAVLPHRPRPKPAGPLAA